MNPAKYYSPEVYRRMVRRLRRQLAIVNREFYKHYYRRKIPETGVIMLHRCVCEIAREHLKKVIDNFKKMYDAKN